MESTNKQSLSPFSVKHQANVELVRVVRAQLFQLPLVDAYYFALISDILITEQLSLLHLHASLHVFKLF